MSQTIAIAMQKGGVGKTTTAINLAAGLAFGDFSTLLVDLDPQANATSGLGFSPGSDDPTVYQWMFGTASLDQVLRSTTLSGLDLIPSSMDLNGARAELPRIHSEYLEVREVLEPARERYDRILIDCPPSLGPLTLNGLMAAGELLIPLQCEYYALEGLSQLWETIQRVKRRPESRLELLGVLLTMYDGRTNLAEDVTREVRSHFGDAVMDTVIPRNIRLSEAPGYGKPVVLHAPDCAGTRAYLAATEEVLDRERHRTGTRT